MSIEIIPSAVPALGLAPNEAVKIIAMQQAGAFRLTVDGQIVWKHAKFTELVNNEAVLAKLVKGESFSKPSLKLIGFEAVPETERTKALTFLQGWCDAVFSPLHEMRKSLLNADITGPAKDIAVSLSEKDGIALRSDLKSAVKALDPEARKSLRDHEVYIRAKRLYCRTALKPAVVKAKAALWRIYNQDFTAQEPPEGNVSCGAQPEGKAPAAFYDYIGFPLQGVLAVRIDMLERVISSLYDGAKGGCYTLTPHLASLIGSSVDGLCGVIESLGFAPAQPLTGVPHCELPEDIEIFRPLHIYRVLPPRDNVTVAKKPHKPRQSKPNFKNKSSKPKKAQSYDPNSPFAKLAGLKVGKS